MSGVRPKKHLGQHFLRDENTARKIVDAIDHPQPSQILEVGAGTGVLTQHLITGAMPFLAFDVDVDSIDHLNRTYPEHTQRFVLKDFLEYSINKDHVVVLGNFPYNISSQLFFHVWDQRDRVDEVVCMLQKEVARRICSSHGNKVYGILSVLLQAFFDVEYHFTVPPGAFHPPPKVHSGVIRLRRNPVKRLACDEHFFKRVVKMAFGKRRKTLRNALKDLALPPELLADELFSKRAEQLSVEDFIDLTIQLERCKES